MEDFQLDLMIGEGPAARSVRIDLPPFTLIGATTRTGLLTTPLRDRFGIHCAPRFLRLARARARSSPAARACSASGRPTTAPPRSRGAPAARRASPPGCCGGCATSRPWRGRPGRSTRSPADALSRLEVDQLGLDALDRRYLGCIAESYDGGPVGVETLAAALSEQRDTLEEVVEPYPVAAGPAAAHAARPPPDPDRLAASAIGAAGRRRGTGRAVRRSRPLRALSR